MPRTRTEIVELALRHLRLLADDESATADQIAYVGDAADMALAEFASSHMSVDWGLDAVPDSVAQALSMLVAADCADHYNRPPVSRSRALGRMLAVLRPDNRPDWRDGDGDGVVDEEEAAAAARALYY